MAMADGPALAGAVEVVFGETRLQIALRLETCFEALTSDVEEKFGLAEGSFSIFDDFGKVANSTALLRAVDSATEGPCILQVREEPVWRKLREMEEKIETLVARCPVADNIMKTIEERSSNRFMKLRSALQDLDAKVNHSIAPLLQSMALQQIDTKSKLESSYASPPFEEMDAKVGSIAALLQSVALQQMELKTKLDSLTETVGIHTANDNTAIVQELRKEMEDLKSGCEEKTAIMEDLGGTSPKIYKSMPGMQGLDEEGHFHWVEGPSSDSFANIAYSGKKLHSCKFGGATAVPFARYHLTRKHDRIHGSCSLPLLPSVK